MTNTFLALNSLMVVMAVAELFITIWSASLCDRAACNGYKRNRQKCRVVRGTAAVRTAHQVMMYSSRPAVTDNGYSMAFQQDMAQSHPAPCKFDIGCDR